ncbi:sigma-E processing peptidase SpoIIGA [Hydrogenispora ethanolica]|nr:sigma-E processing peptidase SpoIIGA [Hydrogenispora ethanolica]
MVKVYLDLPISGAILGWIQDGTLLWMVGQISSARVAWPRLLLGGAIGGAFQFMLLLNQASEGLLYHWVLSPLIFMFLIPWLMVTAAFFPLTLRRFLTIIGYFYLLSFLLSGIHWGIDSLNQRYFHWTITLWWRFCLHLAFIFILGEIGWGVVHRKVWDQICLFPIQIQWQGQNLKLNALLDTGNRLHDPLTKVPVIVVEFNHIKDLLPPEVLKMVDHLQRGELADDLAIPLYWEERVRLLPFHSLGKEHGLMVGFRPDRVSVRQKNQEYESNNVVVAFYNRSLSPEGSFQALIPPAILGT